MDEFQLKRFALQIQEGTTLSRHPNHYEFSQFLLGNRTFEECAVELIEKLLGHIDELEDKVEVLEYELSTPPDINDY